MAQPKRYLAIGFALMGFFCMALGAMLLSPITVEAQDDTVTTSTGTTSNGEYASIKDCNDCHRRVGNNFETTAHAMTMFAAEDYPEAVIADFSVGEDLRLFAFPEEDAERPFTLEDVAFVVGAGQIAQRFVVDLGDKDYRVLPVEWNVEAGAWQSIELPNGDSWTDNCASCHATGYDASTHAFSEESVTCEACHGPGLTHVEAADDAGSSINDEEEAEIKAAINAFPDPSTCSSCHSQPETDATWVDPVHASMGAYDAWAESPHAQLVDLSDMAADDADADSDDEIAAHASPYAMDCAGCHAMHPEDDVEIQPHLLSIDMSEGLCIACHDSNAGELMAGTSIVDNVVGLPSAHHEEGLECESCHNPHSVQSIPDDPSQPATCNECHTDLTQSAIRGFAHGAQERVATRLSTIETHIEADTPEWVSTIVTTIHEDGSGGIHNFAYVSRLLNAAETSLGLLRSEPAQIVPVTSASDPAECTECHADVHDVWQSSPHANASLGDNFQQAYTESGRPSYCMSCHASGYDPNTQRYVFEGVVCSTCHVLDEGAEHPPGPMPIASSSEACGRCHSGEHSPEYNEWLVSDHSNFNVDCVDCHVAHDNSLRLGDVNATCADCHENAMNDEIHMGEDMNCVDCHMTRVDDEGEVIHHTMFFDPKTCAECHGDIHTLQFDPTRNIDDAGQQLVTALQTEVTTLEEKAETNLQSGIVGGAVGAMVLVIFLFIAVRLGRMR
jgi:hypothetical protein